jgi:hypothetical protein
MFVVRRARQPSGAPLAVLDRHARDRFQDNWHGPCLLFALNTGNRLLNEAFIVPAPQRTTGVMPSV